MTRTEAGLVSEEQRARKRRSVENAGVWRPQRSSKGGGRVECARDSKKKKNNNMRSGLASGVSRSSLTVINGSQGCQSQSGTLHALKTARRDSSRALIDLPASWTTPCSPWRRQPSLIVSPSSTNLRLQQLEPAPSSGRCQVLRRTRRRARSGQSMHRQPHQAIQPPSRRRRLPVDEKRMLGRVPIS